MIGGSSDRSPGSSPSPAALREVAALFLRLGLVAFGGPAAHVALMRDEVVRRRRWVTDAEFLDLLGATNLIPGPNSTEMAIHLGYVRAGWRGFVVAGALFILPAAFMVAALAWAYVQYGSQPAATSVLYGVKPVVIAVVIHALWGLTKTAVKGPALLALGLVVLALSLLGINEIALLFGGGIVMVVFESARRRWRGGSVSATVLPLLAVPGPALASTVSSFSVGVLFLTFLKIGAVLYGSGYVLVAFLRHDFVNRLGWLTDRELLDAVAIGQVTPGPVFTAATFVGYLVGRWPGAIVATLGIFLPSFIFVALSNPLIPRLRRSRWTSAVLDGVNVAALGLMAAVTWELSRAAIVDPLTAALALAAVVLLLRYGVNSVWLIAGAGAIGLAVSFWLARG